MVESSASSRSISLGCEMLFSCDAGLFSQPELIHWECMYMYVNEVSRLVKKQVKTLCVSRLTPRDSQRKYTPSRHA